MINKSRTPQLVTHNELKILAFSAFLLGSQMAISEGFTGEHTDTVDTSDWACEYCLTNDHFTGSVMGNAGHVSDDEYRYGNYSGVDGNNQFSLDADLLRIDENARYVDVELENLGLDSPALRSRYGIYGRYQLKLEYQKIPVNKFDQLLTPFSNVGSENLKLPGSWVPIDGANLADPTNFTGFALGNDWERIKLAWRFSGDNNLDYKLSYQRIDKSGLREFSATQLFNATYLPLSLDHQIDTLDARVSFKGDDWWGSMNYQLSRFNNGAESTRYENPFNTALPGSATGQVATEPDNNAIKLGFNFNYKFYKNSWAKLHTSFGRMQQDEQFLPYTTNALLNTGLPSNSLNAKVDTRDLSLRLYSRLSSKFSVRASYRFHEKDNRTDQLAYLPVVTDSFVGSQVTNLTYDYETKKYLIGSDWRFYPGQMASVELRKDTRKRSFSLLPETENQGVEGKLRLSHNTGTQLILKASRFERDATNISQVDLLTVNENPLMHRYNQADRDEDKLSFQLSISPWERLSASFSGDYVDEEYIKNKIGLQENRRVNYGVDINFYLAENISLTLFYITEDIETDMAASQSGGNADWFAKSSDDISSTGISFQLKNLLNEKLDLAFDATHSDADSQIVVTRGSADPLPNNRSKWTTLQARLSYRQSERWTFQLRYQFDDFESNDFAIDSVLPGTVSNLETFGATSNNYNVNYLVASFRYNLM